MLRSKATFFEYGEKMSKYYFNLEIANGKRKMIHRIKNNDGQVLTQNEDMLNCLERFYRQLYMQKDVELRPVPLIIHKMLSNESKSSIDGPIQITELDCALNALKCDKTLGPDGLTINFYRKFWNRLCQLLFNVFLYVVEHGELHMTAYEGLINMIPKKYQDLLLVKNWRPITLLNNDYKILSKALAARIQSVMEEVIGDDQSGFVKGRFIGDNLLSLQAII